MSVVLFFAIPLVVVVAICMFLSNKDSVDNSPPKVSEGRLTQEIISFLRENANKQNLTEIVIKPFSVSAKLAVSPYSRPFSVVGKLTDMEMQKLCDTLLNELGGQFVKEFIPEGADYTPVIGKINSTNVYGKTEYGELAYYRIRRAGAVQHTTNW